MKQLFIPIFVALSLLVLIGCTNNTIVPEVTLAPTELNVQVTDTPFATDTTTPNETQVSTPTPDSTADATDIPQNTADATEKPTATQKPTPKPTPEPTARPKNPAKLSAEKEREIKEAYLEIIKQRYSYNPDVDWDGVTIDNVSLFKYYGTYSGGIAVMLGHNIEGIPAPPPSDAIGDIFGYHFEFANSESVIMIYDNKEFTSIFAAYNSGVLTAEDIRDIHWYYTHQ